eukprot:m.161854 g.161854  ORF g.161854 m.161854 type:complete len:150 (+) comp15192_c0_seq19:76-525(+)
MSEYVHYIYEIMSDTKTSESESQDAILSLRFGSKGVTIKCIVLEKLRVTKTARGDSIGEYLVADETAAINLAVFNLSEYIKNGDILLISNGYCTLHRKRLTVYVGQQGTIRKTNEFTLMYQEDPNMSATDWEPDSVTERGPVSVRPANK